MVANYQKGSQTKAARRRRFWRWPIALGFTLSVIFAGLWMLITQPIPGSAQTSGASSVSSERLKSHVIMLSETLAPRDYAHPENLDRIAQYLQEQFNQAGGKVSEQPYKVDGKTYRNVIALFGPETKERIVIGAHYDAFDGFPGADDNASGVAGLIELAFLLGKTELPMQVELVAYTLEEPPYFRTDEMGSAVHAASLKHQGTRVRAVIVLEMIGYFSDAPGSQHYPSRILKLFYPSKGNFITVVGNFSQMGLTRRIKKAMHKTGLIPVRSINAPRWIAGIDFSDHLNYWEAGYKAVMITDTAFYRNENYHTPQDTPQILDYQRLAAVVQAIKEAVLTIAQTN